MKFFIFFLSALIGIINPLNVNATSITNFEQITSEIGNTQNQSLSDFGKYSFIPKTNLVDGYYKVDHYETPCNDGFQPPICQGYQIYFFDLKGNLIFSDGKGLLNLPLTAVVNDLITKINFVSSTL